MRPHAFVLAGGPRHPRLHHISRTEQRATNSLNPRVIGAAAAVALLVGCAAPTAWSLSAWQRPANGTFTDARPVDAGGGGPFGGGGPGLGGGGNQQGLAAIGGPQLTPRETVDAFHAAALEAGGTDNGAPGVREMYHPNYYGAYVLDPDGHNIEACCHKPE